MNMNKILLISIMALSVSTTYADNTATVAISAGGNVIADLSVTAGATMALPDLVAPSATDGDTSVTLACNLGGSKTIAYSGQGNPFAAGTVAATAVAGASTSANVAAGTGNHSGTCATATVMGQAGYAFAITTVDPTAGTNIAVTGLTCKGTTTLSGSGESILHCGATVTASAGVSLGGYTANDGTVTVTYD